MSDFNFFSCDKRSDEGVGTPISSLAAGDVKQIPSEGKNHFEDSASPAESLLPVVPRCVSVVDSVPQKNLEKFKIEQEQKRKEKHQQDLVKRSSALHPNGRGRRNNLKEFNAVQSEFDNGLPFVPKIETRPVPKTPELRSLVCLFISSGGTLTEFARRSTIPRYTLAGWIEGDPVFKTMFEKAKQEGIDAIAEEALRVASEPFYQQEVIETYDKDGKLSSKAVKHADSVYARKLSFHARLQLLQKWAPQKYGDKPERGDSETRAAKILEARRRISGKGR